MNPAAETFKLDEEVSFGGKPMRVAGFVQYEGPDAQVSTRYLLAEPAGAPVILEETGGQFAVLRPFPSTAQPQARRGLISVMGARYALTGVRKRKVLGCGGQPPGGTPKADLVLSGLFEGEMGALVREMTPGTGAQTFYFLKTVAAHGVLSDAQRAAMLEMDRLSAETKAWMEDEDDAFAGSSRMVKAATWIVVAIVVASLAYACSGPL
jgi:hypothetical protein